MQDQAVRQPQPGRPCYPEYNVLTLILDLFLFLLFHFLPPQHLAKHSSSCSIAITYFHLPPNHTSISISSYQQKLPYRSSSDSQTACIHSPHSPSQQSVLSSHAYPSPSPHHLHWLQMLPTISALKSSKQRTSKMSPTPSCSAARSTTSQLVRTASSSRSTEMPRWKPTSVNAHHHCSNDSQADRAIDSITRLHLIDNGKSQTRSPPHQQIRDIAPGTSSPSVRLPNIALAPFPSPTATTNPLMLNPFHP